MAEKTICEAVSNLYMTASLLDQRQCQLNADMNVHCDCTCQMLNRFIIVVRNKVTWVLKRGCYLLTINQLLIIMTHVRIPERNVISLCIRHFLHGTPQEDFYLYIMTTITIAME